MSTDIQSSESCFKCLKTATELGRTESLKHCAKCRAAVYCSRKCQVDDWKLHKKSCSNSSTLKTPAEPTTSSRRERRHLSQRLSTTPVDPLDPFPPYHGTPQDRGDREAAERVMNMMTEVMNPNPRLDAVERAGWGFFPDPRLPPGMPSRRDFMESKNSSNPDYDSPNRPAFMTTIARLTQGNNIGARTREASANTAFEREYAASSSYLVGRKDSPFKLSAVREIVNSKELLVALAQKFPAYEFAIDAYILRRWEQYDLFGFNKAFPKYNPIQHFGDFLDKAHNKGLLPAWWISGGELLNMVCIRLAMKPDGGACILQCLGQSDMQKKYGYDRVVVQLRRFAVDVYGTAVTMGRDQERLGGGKVWFVEDSGEWELPSNTLFNTLFQS